MVFSHQSYDDRFLTLKSHVDYTRNTTLNSNFFLIYSSLYLYLDSSQLYTVADIVLRHLVEL